MGEAVQEEKASGMREEEAGKEELNQLVSALKDAIMDLRETVSELSNPLIRLSTPTQAPTGMRGNQEGTTSSRELESEVEEKKLETTSLSEGKKKKEEISELPSFTLPIVSPTKGLHTEETREEAGASGRIQLRKVLSILKLLLELKESVDTSLIDRYVGIFRRLNLVSDEEANVLRDLIDLVTEGSKYRLTAEDHVAIMALLAKTLGIRDEELEEESLKILLSTVKKRIKGLGTPGSDSSRES